MLDNSFSFTDEQLFAELTPEEGAAISGGTNWTYEVENTTGSEQIIYWMDKFYKPNKVSIKNGETVSFKSHDQQVTLLFDQDANPTSLTLAGGKVADGFYRLSQTGNTVNFHIGNMPPVPVNVMNPI
ncbi:hypothetical protein [Chroococcidiopsis sp. CCNUC1]|uniref:hypothetical protein n=1 Tax=Chroococcidiopsis sp. CCNUC1 TaxID=2653189 RepID=UPI0020225DAA|nr:hypothetical protein [Chroococcidiopsis sp. CCNUC1]URD49793.1 hypothetical protein M5J74_26210 [Chroococcidiopsis sp. CCNUC1]